ncbi:unnamed protein product [Pelagomonas calceolata]|uniref:Gfo/Idh/MocA-like oxidoreductase N-terminal domain-containing protein n=1 Tax=Pelagomonas calceolata TaxID=35677 RepID=A0A8J2SEN9_9STRA|nr:unnamed protein product [Pelagomonas calceolata]|mmetsp:Transcript_8625/g.26956  ORF Transcript_8625/g.26956 Transcript_8625/m.26956 type:complete len:419 (-) Transcript_8625:23-1279(-)
MAQKPNVLMLGTGEYTTGWVGKASDSDKSTGVVALVMLDLKRRNKINNLAMCGTSGPKLPQIREHMRKMLGAYEGIDPGVVKTFPADDVVDREAYKGAISTLKKGDCAIIFTPDDTHFQIAEHCIKNGIHVMITKPPVKTLEEHNKLAALAKEQGVLCCIEVHKRYDPIYRDARDRIQQLGAFSFFQAYMSQPKHQLETFKAWAGKSSDISYYLNSHHVDFHEWCCSGNARPERVVALSSTGVAQAKLGRPCEDTITLSVQWRTLATNALGHALYTSSWVAPKADVHSQQRWFYMGQSGEVTVDQAHRGYTVCTDSGGYGSVNPLFWKPTPSDGKFVGQACYGYVSFEAFVDAATSVNSGELTLDRCDRDLPTMASTAGATAILEAGRRSLDANGAPFDLIYQDDASCTPIDMKPSAF